MSLLPPQFPEPVVAIGNLDKNGLFIADSTGFIVGYGTGEKNDKGEDLFGIYLVTNKHVLAGREQIVVRFNSGGKDSHNVAFPLKDSEGTLWLGHENQAVDIAVVGVPLEALQKQGIKNVWFNENLILDKGGMASQGVRTGDEVFVLGFPLGIAGVKKNYPIVRSGMIARLDEEILNQENCFYIDAPIFGGNSGGPVILKPSIMSTTGTTAVNRAYILGVIAAVRLEKEFLYGKRNGQEELRMILYEHSGLGIVIPMDFVSETVELLRKEIGVRKSKESEMPEEGDINKKTKPI